MLQRNEKTFSFRSFQGAPPTTEQLREELEKLYKYLAAGQERLLKQLDGKFDTIDSSIANLQQQITANKQFILSLQEDLANYKVEVNGRFEILVNRLTADELRLVPVGFIGVWTGLLANIPSGWFLCDGSNGTPDMIDRFVKGVQNSSTDPGAIGGVATHSHGVGTYVASDTSAGTPSGTISAVSAGTPSGTISSVSAGTPSGTLDSVSAGTPAGTLSSESAHTHSVTSNVSVADHSAHTHSVTAAGTNANESSHTHGVGTFATSGDAATTATGSSGAVKPTATHTHTITGTSAAGSAHTHTFTGSAVTSGNPSATLTHSVTNNAVTSGAGSSHTHTFTGSALAGHTHTFTGSAMGTHNHTFTGSALGTHTHTFTGDALPTHTHTLSGDSEDVDARPPWYEAAFIMYLGA